MENIETQYQNLWQQFQSEYQSTKLNGLNISKKANDSFYAFTFSIARSVTNRLDAEDITHDVLLSFLDAPPKMDIENLSQYVYRAIKNRYINLSIAYERRIIREEKYLIIQEWSNDIEDAEDREEKIKVQKKLLFVSLKLKEQEVQLLKMLFTLPLEEIADEMNISLKTVQNKKSLLLKKIKSQYP